MAKLGFEGLRASTETNTYIDFSLAMGRSLTGKRRRFIAVNIYVHQMPLLICKQPNVKFNAEMQACWRTQRQPSRVRNEFAIREQSLVAPAYSISIMTHSRRESP